MDKCQLEVRIQIPPRLPGLVPAVFVCVRSSHVFVCLPPPMTPDLSRFWVMLSCGFVHSHWLQLVVEGRLIIKLDVQYLCLPHH